MAISSERLQIQRALGHGPRHDPRFLDRRDGTFDYFPDGQDRRGYRLTEHKRRWIAEIELAFLPQALAGLAGVIAAVYFAAEYLDDSRPELAIYVDSWVLRLGAAVPLAGVVLRILGNTRRSQIRQVLEQAPQEPARIEPGGEAAHFARRWVEMSVARRLVLMLGAPLLTTFLAYDAAGRAMGADALAECEAMVLGSFAALIGLGYVWLLAKLIRSRPGG